MYTPQEVSEKTFPKSTGLTSGYNMTAVDEFLDGLTEDYTALYKDNTTLKAKLKMLAEKVEEYRATEDAMRSTLLAAQKMAAQMVADAQAQAEQILADARGEADVQARQLQQEIRDSWEKLATAQSETEDFIQRSRDLCAQQLAFLDSLPERNAPEQEDQEPENEAVTLPAPEENAVPVADAEPVPQEEAPQPESAAEPEPQPEFQEKKEEESPFPLDFKLNLEDLQFGRNYNGGDRR